MIQTVNNQLTMLSFGVLVIENCGLFDSDSIKDFIRTLHFNILLSKSTVKPFPCGIAKINSGDSIPNSKNLRHITDG